MSNPTIQRIGSWFLQLGIVAMCALVLGGFLVISFDAIIESIKRPPEVVMPRNVSQELYQMHDQQVKGLFLFEIKRLEQRIEYLEAKVK